MFKVSYRSFCSNRIFEIVIRVLASIVVDHKIGICCKARSIKEKE